MGYVLAACGTLLACSLVWIGVSAYRSDANRYQREVQILELAYGRIKTQEIAAHLPTVEPPLSVLLGNNGIDGTQGAPPEITFAGTIFHGYMLTCDDDTGAGRYVCTSKKIPATAK